MIYWVFGGIWDVNFLTSFLGILMLLVYGVYWEEGYKGFLKIVSVCLFDILGVGEGVRGVEVIFEKGMVDTFFK